MLFLMAKYMRIKDQAHKLCLACFLRATLAAVVATVNSDSSGFTAASSWVDGGLCCIFSVVYAYHLAVTGWPEHVQLRMQQ
jgi:hypothetical protein